MRSSLHVMLVTLFLFSGCALKHEINSSQAYLVTIKNPDMALSDTGFLNRGKDYTNVQIFAAGNALFNLEITENTICLNGRCFDKVSFNQEFFHQKHYATFMEEIINHQPLYGGMQLHKTATGFEQELDLPQSHIHYNVDGETLLFKDTKNSILIRLKLLP